MPSCNDLIDVNPFHDLVTFQDIPENYTPGKDIFVIYQLGESFRPTAKDWVGLYRLGYVDIRQYIAFQWAPKKPKSNNSKYIRSVFFLGKNFQDVAVNDQDLFQFLYISKGSQIVGVSRRFTICSNPQPQLECVDRVVENFGSMTFVELVKSNAKVESDSCAILDGFEFLEEETQPLLAEEIQPLPAEEPRWDVVPAQNAEEDSWLASSSNKKLNEEADMTINMSDNMYDQMKLVINQLQTSFAPMEYPLPRAASPKCAHCLKRKAQINELQTRSRKLNEEWEEMQSKLSENADILEMKEWLVTALSEQVKNLVAENTTLHVMKDKMQAKMDSPKACKKCKKMLKKLSALESENKKLKQELLTVTHEVNALQARQQTESENEERLKEKCRDLEEDLKKWTETMPGNCATWQIAPPKNRSRAVAMAKTAEITANLNEKIQELETNVESMTNEVKNAQAQLVQKDEDLVTILKRRDELILQNEQLSERIDQLEHSLTSEQRKRCEQVRKHRDTECDLNERISSLSAALEDAHLEKSTCMAKSKASQMSAETSHTSCQTQISDQYALNDFSFSNFLSRGMESLSRQFEESTRPLMGPKDESEPLREVIPSSMFDFYPTSLPEPETNTWSKGPHSAPPISTKNEIEVDDISLGNACSKQKIVLDFRNEDVTKEVVDATNAQKFRKSASIEKQETADTSTVWQWQTPEEEEPEEPKIPVSPKFDNARKTRDRFRARSSPKTRARVSKTKRSVKGKSAGSMLPRPTTSGQIEDTSIVCPYCDHVFKESTSLSTISRHIENHTQ